MQRKKILAITAGGPYPWVIINALGDQFGALTVIEEEAESKAHFLRRRARKVGMISAAGQFATMVISRFGKRLATNREQQIIDEFDLRTDPAAEHNRIPVTSANSPQCLEIIKSEKPDLIFLAGCRMLSAGTLSALDVPVINYHAGINPKYRGMMGGYWALVNNDPQNFGTTVHLVDQGVDTGGILRQRRFLPSRQDTMATYAMIMAAHSREICIRAVTDVLEERVEIIPSDLPSKQWFHPPIWSYLWTGLTRRIW